MTNRPNLTEEEKVHYNKVAMDKIYEDKIVDALETIANAAGHGDFCAIIDALEYGNAIDPELNEKWYKLYTERDNTKFKTPRTDEADKFVTYANKLDGKAYATEWVYASFAQDLEIELEKVELERDALWVKAQEDEREINDLRDINNELRQWKEEALKVMNQWNEVSDYINLNAEVEDLGRFVPQICLKYLKERDEMKKKLEVS
jgi:hypothetical protein